MFIAFWEDFRGVIGREVLVSLLKSAISEGVEGGFDFVTEGSYNIIYVKDTTVLRWTPARLGRKFIDRVLRGVSLASSEGWTDVICYGSVYKGNQREFVGFTVFMRKLERLKQDFDDESSVYAVADEIASVGFHNDFKIDNLMQDSYGRINAIDYDFFSTTQLTISVSASQTVELDLSNFLGQLDEETRRQFRVFYDYTYLSASLGSLHPLYPKILARLIDIFILLQGRKAFDLLLNNVDPQKLSDIPLEVLVRVPDIDAVSYHLLDLRGNAFAHRCAFWSSLPSRIRSSGVYWSDR